MKCRCYETEKKKQNTCPDCRHSQKVYEGKYICLKMRTKMGSPLTYDDRTTYCFAKCCGEMWEPMK